MKTLIILSISNEITRNEFWVTNLGLLLHYQSHVDNWYKNGLLRTMLDWAHCLSSSWSHFWDECDLLKTVFSCLKYPKHLNPTIKSFVDSKVCDRWQLSSPSQETDGMIPVTLPFEDQISANWMRTECERNKATNCKSAVLLTLFNVTCVMQVM